MKEQRERGRCEWFNLTTKECNFRPPSHARKKKSRIEFRQSWILWIIPLNQIYLKKELFVCL